MGMAAPVVKRTVFFPSNQELLTHLKKHPSTCHESEEVNKIAARLFSNFYTQKPEIDIQNRLIEMMEYELWEKLHLPEAETKRIITNFTPALKDSVNGRLIRG